MGLGIALKSASSTSVQLAVLPLVWPGRTSQACASDTSAMYPSDDTPLSRCPAIPCPSTIPPPSAKGQSDRAESLAVSSMLLCASLQEAIPTTERSSMTTISNSPGIKVDRGPAYDMRARAIILACADAATQLRKGERREPSGRRTAAKIGESVNFTRQNLVLSGPRAECAMPIHAKTAQERPYVLSMRCIALAWTASERLLSRQAT